MVLGEVVVIFQFGIILFGKFLDVRYCRMGHFLLALEAHLIMAR